MAYDSHDGYVVMFGGCGSICPLGDVWKYKAGLWTLPTFSGATPLPRVLFGMADDANDGYVVLFRGATGSTGGSYGAVARDTWKIAGGTWTRI
jgi:hypothetical protein